MEPTVTETQDSEQDDTGTDTDTWYENAKMLRSLEENGTLPATITDWEITNNGDTAIVYYQLQHDGSTHTDQFHAEVIPGEQSEFESFVESLGFSIETAAEIQEENPEARVKPIKRSSKGTNWRLSMNTQSGDKHENEEDAPQWANSQSGWDNIYEDIFIMVALGPISTAYLVKMIMANNLSSNYSRHDIGLCLGIGLVSTMIYALILGFIVGITI